MRYQRFAVGLGWFSLALGAVELLGAKRITRALESEGHEGLVKGFGAREVANGAALLGAPGHAPRMWARVAGDALDLGALALAARSKPGNKAIWGAIGFVVGATALDLLVARGLSHAPDYAPNGPGHIPQHA